MNEEDVGREGVQRDQLPHVELAASAITVSN